MTEKRSFPKTKEIKRRARELLGQKNIILKLIFAAAICWATNMAVDIAEACVYYTAQYFGALDLASASQLLILNLAFELVALFCVSAQAMGTFRLARLLTEDKDARLTEMFYYWRGARRYFRSLLGFLIIAAPVKLFLLAFEWILRDVLPMIYLNDPTVFSMIIYFFALVGALLAGFLLGALLLLPYSLIFSAAALLVRYEEKSIGACIKQSASATRAHLVQIFEFRSSFLPLILLSFVTVGVLLVIYTVPYMLVSYFYYNAALFEDEISAADMEVTFDER